MHPLLQGIYYDMVENKASFSHVILALSHLIGRAYPQAFAVPEHKVCSLSVVRDVADTSLDGRQLQLYGVSFKRDAIFSFINTNADVCDV